MKSVGLVFLFCLFIMNIRAQEVEEFLHITDSLSAQPEKAIEILNKALENEPDSEELLKVRAEAYETLEQYAKAVKDYQTLAELSPDEENIWYLLGRNQYYNGQYQEAMTSLDHATKLNSKYLPAFHTKIRILLDLNKNDEALKVSDSTLMVGETATNYFLQGEIYRRLNSRQKAEWAYDKATKIDKGYIEAYIALADIAASMNKAMETLVAADEALGIDPDSKEALIARSRGFALMNNYTDAIDDVSYIIRLDPGNTDAYFWRGTYYKETNKPAEAIKDFNQVLKVQPANWKALAGRADSYARAGDKKAALTDYRQLLANASGYPESETISKLAEQQIFELNRETHIPELVLVDPQPDGFDLQVPDNQKSITLQGTITDESRIKKLTVNGQEIPVTGTENKYEFSATVKLDTAQQIQIEVADVYDNVNKLTYHLARNETVKPKIALFAPKPSDSGTIILSPGDNATLYIEGKVTDDSTIESIMVDGNAVDFDHEATDPSFSAIIDIENKNKFSVSATDKYGNTVEQTYYLEKIETADVLPENSPADTINMPVMEEASQ